MHRLAIETSTEACSVALLAGGAVRSRFEVGQRLHGERLLPWVRELLAEAGLAAGRLDSIAVGRGPGGFTSLRIGIGVVQGLALAHDLPVYPVSSLAALAWQAARAGGAGDYLALHDARMGEVYAGWYRIDGGAAQALAAERVGPPGDLPCLAGNWRACGPGRDAYAETLAARLGDTLVAQHAGVWPGAEGVLALADQAEPIGAGAVTPVYLRDNVATPKVQ